MSSYVCDSAIPDIDLSIKSLNSIIWILF